MAKIDLSSLSPNALSQFKGRVALQMRKNGTVATKWPRKRKFGLTAKQLWYQQLFATAAHLASQPCWLDQATAVYLAKGTTNVPRDLLTSAALGGLYLIVNQDGTEWTTNPHLPPEDVPAPQFEDLDMIYWPQNPTGSISGSKSTTASNYKGMAFIPTKALQIKRLYTHIALPANTQAKFTIVKLSSANAVTEILFADATAAEATPMRLAYIDCDITIDAYQYFAILTSIVGAAAAGANPIYTINNADYAIPTQFQYTCVKAVADLAVGDTMTISTTTSIYDIGFAANY